MAETLSENPSTFTYSPEAKEALLELTLNWARYDSLVGQWLITAFGMSLDHGAIMIGSMDTRGKLDKLKALYTHHRMTKTVENVADLHSAHMGLVGIRNTIMHAGCGGLSKTDDQALVFAPLKNSKGEVGMMLMESIPIWQIKLAAQFAKDMGDAIFQFVIPLLAVPPQEPPPPPPQFLPGFRQAKKERNGKGRKSRQKPSPGSP